MPTLFVMIETSKPWVFREAIEQAAESVAEYDKITIEEGDSEDLEEYAAAKIFELKYKLRNAGNEIQGTERKLIRALNKIDKLKSELSEKRKT